MKAILSIQTPGVSALGLDLVWDNEDFEFKLAPALGVFDEFTAGLFEGTPTRLIVAAQNTTERNIISTLRGMDIAELVFEWKEGADPAAVVAFLAENVTAHNTDGEVVPVTVEVANYEAGGETIVRLVWE